jgi:GDP-4-dehydro-6-deoxy-D-mannose reductase
LRILITGAAGFVGQHLAGYLADLMPNAELYGTTLGDEKPTVPGNLVFCRADLRNPQQINELVADVRPEFIYHLAAQAFVPLSFQDPWDTLENNIRSQVNIIQACLREQIRPRMLVISSAEIYGYVSPDQLPITEDTELRPTSPYAVSKITQDMLALQYCLSHDLPIMRARPFNHFGPGQGENFVAPAFAMQIARIEAGQQEPIIKVGDLSPQRDFTDVRDIVRAYHLIMERGAPGAVYNVACGQAHSIQSLLDHLLAYSDREIEVVVDPDRLRPGDMPILRGDYTRLKQATGWQPQIPFEQTLADILDDCRRRIHQ